MKSSSLQKILKSQGHYQSDLVTLDFKSQSLNKFLENVVQIVNHHSKRINSLQMDKITIQAVKQSNAKILTASKISPVLINELPATKHPIKQQSLEQIIEGICYNQQNSGNALSFLYESLKKKDQKMNEIHMIMSTLQKAEQARQNFKKTAQTAKKYTDDEVTKVLTRLKQLQMKTNKKIAEFQNLTKQVQKKTLWKINQCESALLKKITPDYVDKALDQIQAKIHSDIKNSRNQQINQLKFNLQTQKNKLDTLCKDHDEKQKENKQWLKDLDQTCKLLEKKEKAEEDRRENDLKIKELLLKIDRLQKRQDPKDLDLRISKLIHELQEKSTSHYDKLKKLDDQLDSIKQIMSSMGGAGGVGDPHKLCQIDGQVKRLRDANRTNESKLQTLQEELKTKLIIFQERIMSTLAMLKGQDNFVSRQEMYQSLSRLRQPVTEKLSQNQNLIHQMSGKISKLQLFEKATKRKIKQLTRGDELNKILDMKMNVGQAQTHFNSINMKSQNLEIILNKVKMEVEANSAFLKQLQDYINDPQQGVNILGPKQKVFPAKCLGCGIKHIPPVYDNNMMMGTDGKYYKVDLRPGNFENQVYGVTANQIAVYETSSKKTRISSARGNSSRKFMRPTSATRF